MKSVSSLSQSELNSLISEASRELEARKRSETVVRDIHKVLDKHGIAKRERSTPPSGCNEWRHYIDQNAQTRLKTQRG